MPTPSPKVVQATQDQHKQIMAVAKLTKWTRDFGNHIFSGPEHYRKGWIRVVTKNNVVIGFMCFRLKVRTPETKLYFVGVVPATQHKGVGRLLMNELERLSAGRKVCLDCSDDNPANGFYEKLGYTRAGRALNNTATRWEKEIPAG